MVVFFIFFGFLDDPSLRVSSLVPNLQVLERSVQAWYSISRYPKGLHKPQFLKPYDASRLASSGAKLFALGRCVG